MQLSDLGEFNLIAKLKERFSFGLPNGVVGIGDDAAVIPFSDTHSYLISTDLLIENTHFLRNETTPEDLGYKSLAVNLSDIAAMGGSAKFALLSLALPKEIEVEWVHRFTKGFGDFASKNGLFLIGGDTSASPAQIFVSVVAIGLVETRNIKRRNSARAGDVICVTDSLGDSALGLKIMLEKLNCDADAMTLMDRHHHPIPNLDEGAFLSGFSAVHAMMDTSDGIISDIERIVSESNCAVRLDVEKIPRSLELSRYCKNSGLDANDFALAGGEDYKLLLTVDKASVADVQSEFAKKFDRPLAIIGEVLEGKASVCVTLNGLAFVPKNLGFRHF